MPFCDYLVGVFLGKIFNSSQKHPQLREAEEKMKFFFRLPHPPYKYAFL